MKIAHPLYGTYWLARQQVAAASGQGTWQPASDIQELATNYEIRMDLPAVDPESVAVLVQDGVLTVSGERNAWNGKDGDKSHCQERHYGRFERRFRLPEDVDSEAINASSSHGELALRLAKKAQLQPKTIKVQVNG